jgi:hypothetical protein
MDPGDLHGRLARLDRQAGAEERQLLLGDLAVRIAGLDAGLAGELDRRWGGFLSRRLDREPACTVRVFDAGPEGWLEAPLDVEAYRIEARNAADRRVIASYHFALARDAGPATWRLGLTCQDREPRQRCLDNAVRFLVAQSIVARGGFAMHAAGVLRNGRAYLFAGPSRAGKTTAVALAAPARSIGDDFALVVPRGEEWMAPAVPFDNSERVRDRPSTGAFPVAGIWRLYQATSTRVEDPRPDVAVATLMGCTAFPWTLPELAPRLLEHVEAFVASGRFHHLHFSKDEPLRNHLG